MSDEIEIVYYDGINCTPALDLAMRGWADCTEKGLGDGTLNVYASLKAFVAYAPNGRDQVAVGVVTFDHLPTEKRVWLYQAYTLPEFRGRGIYRALWEKLVEHSITVLKASSIQYGTHVRNTAMRAVAKKLGQYEESVVVRFDLP